MYIMYLQMLGFLHTVVFIRYQHVCLKYLVNMFKVEYEINSAYMVCFPKNNLYSLSPRPLNKCTEGVRFKG